MYICIYPLQYECVSIFIYNHLRLLNLTVHFALIKICKSRTPADIINSICNATKT